MGKFFITLALLVLLVHSVTANKEENVYVVSETNFDNFISEHKNVVLEFYAPWCGHCQELEPVYKAAANKVKSSGFNTVFAKIDGTQNTNLMSKYNIDGYPTLLFFNEGVHMECEARTEDELFNFVQNQEEKRYIQQLDVDKPFKIEGLTTQLVYYSKGAPKQDYDTFSKLAYSLQRTNHRFFYTDEEPSVFNETFQAPQLVLYKNYNVPKILYDQKFDLSIMEKWLHANTEKLIIEMDDSVHEKIFQKGLLSLLVMIDDSQESQDLYNGLKQKMRIEEVDLFVSSVHKQNSRTESLIDYLGLPSSGYPHMVVIKAAGLNPDKKTRKWLFKNANTTDIDKLFLNYVSGDYQEKDATVKSVRYNKFYEVLNSTSTTPNSMAPKELVVFFYFTGCGPCRQVQKFYQEAADFMRGNPAINKNLRFIQIEQQIEKTQENVKTFPTIRFYRAKNMDKIEEQRTYIDMNAFRSKNKIINFIQRNTQYKENKLPAIMDTEQLMSSIEDHEKTTIVLFTASWCEHCQQAIQIFKYYVEFNENPKLIYGIIDINEEDNSITDKLEQIPEIYMWKNGKKIILDDGISLKTIANWIEKNTGISTTFAKEDL